MIAKRTASAGIYVIGAFFLLSCALMWWSFFTASGSNASLGVLQNRMQNLDYTYRSGNLATGLVLDDIEWQLKNNTRLVATDVALRWDPSCWRGKEICFSSIAVKDLRVILPPGDSTTDIASLPEITLPFSIATEELEIVELVIERAAATPTVFTNFKFSGSLRGSTILADHLQLHWSQLQLSGKGKLDMTDNYPVRLALKVASVDQYIALPIQSDWNIGGDLLELELNGETHKPAKGTATGSLSVLNREFPASINLHWDNAQWPLDSTEPSLEFNDGEFRISGTWPDYNTNASTDISGPGIPDAKADLSGKINSHRATFNSLNLNTLGGTIRTTGSLKWRNGIAWNTRLTATELWPDLHWAGLKGLISGEAVFNGLSNNGQTRLSVSEIDSTVGVAGNVVTVTGNASRGIDGEWHLAGVEASSKRNTLSANGPVGLDSNLTLYFSLNSPEDFLHGVSGDIHGNLNFSGDIRQPDVFGSASASRLSRGGMALKNARVNGTLRAMGETESDVQFAADTFDINNRRMRNLSASINGSLVDHFIQLSLDAPPFSDHRIEVTGSVDEYSNWNGKVNTASGRLAERPFRLQHPVTTTWVNGQQTVAVQPHCWEIDHTSICTDEASLLGKNGSIKFSLDKFDLTTITPLLPDQFGVGGNLSSTGDLTWGPTISPSITVQSVITDAVVAVPNPQNRDRIQIELTDVEFLIATQNNTISTRLQAGSKDVGIVNAEVNINTLRNNYPLDGVVSVEETQLDWLATYLPQVQRISGNATTNAIIGGYLSKPAIAGKLQISDASLSASPLPELSELQLNIDMSNTAARIRGTAKAGDAQVNLEGQSAQFDSQWQTDLRIKANDIQVNHEYVTKASVSPNLKIAIRPNKVDITGDLKISDTDIVVNSIENGGVPLSPDVVIVDAVQNDIGVRTSPSKPVNTNIHVFLDQNVHFNGYGLKADLSGDFNVLLDGQHAPELLGSISMESGTYRSYGQNLLIRKGSIGFVGPLKQAAVSVVAVRETGNVLAGLQIAGSLANPQATLFSEPALPEEEILSYVVLGRQFEFGAESIDDSNLLARAALFMGITNGRKLSRSIAEGLGIDELTLTSSGSGDDTQLMVSGQINDRLLVRYGIGVFNSVRTLFVRYDLAEKLYLETTQSFAEGLEKAIDIFYSFDF